MGLLSQTQHFLPSNREATHSWSAYLKNRMTSPGDKTMALVMQSSGEASWSMLVIKHPPYMHGMVGFDHLLHLPALFSPVYNNVFWGRWVVSLMLRGYWPLWWQSASSPEPKRHFGGKQLGCESTSFPEMISSIGSHTTSPSFPIHCNDNGKGEAPFCEFAAPFVSAVLHFPMLWQKHQLCIVSQYPVHWISRLHNRCKGLEIVVSARTKS